MSYLIEQGTLTSLNPATGDTVWSGTIPTDDAIQSAIAAAEAAAFAWSTTPLKVRADVLRAYAGILGQRKELLAGLISKEIGKPLWEARTEVTAMINKVELSIRAHESRCAEFGAGNATTRFRPHGLVAVLGPYNFPGHLPNGHICPALLAGNCVLFKPSELAPATGIAMTECWQAAGLPDGVLHCLPGGPQQASAIINDSRVRGIFFTGSAKTGKFLARQFADQPGKILALEMGGNNPLIVETGHIANLTAAAEIAAYSAFISTGQRCTCARRLIVIRSPQTDAFLQSLVDFTRSMTCGLPDADPQPLLGPLASAGFVPPVMQAQAELIAAGGKALLTAQAGAPNTGFISPAIIDCTHVNPLADEEVFGPLLKIIQCDSLADAVTIANQTRYGLAAGLLSDVAEHYQFVYPRLHAGLINWNQQLTGASSAAPFGGIGDSGNHRPSAWFAADYCSFPVASIERDTCQSVPSPI